MLEYNRVQPTLNYPRMIWYFCCGVVVVVVVGGGGGGGGVLPFTQRPWFDLVG